MRYLVWLSLEKSYESSNNYVRKLLQQHCFLSNKYHVTILRSLHRHCHVLSCYYLDPIPFLRGAPSSLQQTSPGADSRLALQGAGEVSVTAHRLNILQSPNLFVNIVVNGES